MDNEANEAEFKRCAAELSKEAFQTELSETESRLVLGIEASGTGINVRRYGKQWVVRFYLGGKARYWAFCSDVAAACRIADLLKWRTKGKRIRGKGKPLTDEHFNLGMRRPELDNKLEGKIVGLLFAMEALLPEPKPQVYTRSGAVNKTARGQYLAQMAEVRAIHQRLHDSVMDRLTKIESQNAVILSELSEVKRLAGPNVWNCGTVSTENTPTPPEPVRLEQGSTPDSFIV